LGLEGVTVYLGMKRRNSGDGEVRGFSSCNLGTDGAVEVLEEGDEEGIKREGKWGGPFWRALMRDSHWDLPEEGFLYCISCRTSMTGPVDGHPVSIVSTIRSVSLSRFCPEDGRSQFSETYCTTSCPPRRV
jgi:hypothetical protein